MTTLKKQDYFGALRNQCMSLQELCGPQINGIKTGLLNTIPTETLKKIRKVILTGCGDSYLAAKASIPAFKKYAGAFGLSFIAKRAIDVSRYLELNKDAQSTLVVAVSASGSAKRLQEVLRRANNFGCATLVITNNPVSIAAMETKYRLIVNTPSFITPNPGLRNYYASYAGLFSLAVILGEAGGVAKSGALEELFDKIKEYTELFSKSLEEIDNQMFTLAQIWKDFKAFDTIGDNADYSTAGFIGAKIVEVCGIRATAVNSEDWCHVNFFTRNPETIGTIVVGTVGANNNSRIGETIHQAAKSKRPVLLISDGTSSDFNISESITVCTLPKAPDGFEFLSAMLKHVPGSIVASYMAALLGEPYFRDFEHKNAMTITTSELVIVN